MRFLHTSDWHVGKPLRNHKRDDEYVAVLHEVLDIAGDRDVDCLLVAGDVFDTAVPTPDAERIVFHFFGELAGAGIPAVVIAGNHDHPRRWNAYAPVLRHIGVEVRGEPVTLDEGGVIKVASRDETETATIAALPWVSERKVRDFESLMEEGKHAEEYAEGVAAMISHLAGGFAPDTVRILIAHLLVSGAAVGGPESGERELHMGQAYAINPQRLPADAQYIALGHVHNPRQPNLKLTNAQYSGSLLQCDFGEAGQEKRVNVVEASPGRKARVESVPLRSIRQLKNIGSHKAGVTLDELRTMGLPDDGTYHKVFVRIDRPLPGLAEQVREIAPNVVDIVVQHPDSSDGDEAPDTRGKSAAELFDEFHQSQYGTQPAPALAGLFNQLYEEATGATD